MPKYNWQAIEEEYTNAPSEEQRPTLEALAAKHGCSPSYIREKAAAEHWKTKANMFLETVGRKRQDQKSTALAGELATWDSECYEAAQLMLDALQTRLEIASQGDGLSMGQLDDASKSLERIHKIGKAALGEEEKIKVSVDFNNLSDEQLARIAAGEDPRDVCAIG